MKIGISVCTTPKRYSEVKLYTPFCENQDIFFLINNDINYNGAPSSRNYCIKKMMDENCDLMMLFDDDCYPIMKGYDKYIAENMLNNDIHFIGMSNIFKDKLISYNNEITFWNGQIGCFSAFTRKHIEVVGYYNTTYEKYGFTDPPYTFRSKISQLSKNKNYYASLLRVPFYIRSEDVYNANPTQNYSFEEKQKFIKKNIEIYNQEIIDAENGKIFYPYTNKNEI